jgi:hypothetical protein
MIDNITGGFENHIDIDKDMGIPSTTDNYSTKENSTGESDFDKMLNSDNKTPAEQLEEILPALLEMIQQLIEMIASSASESGTDADKKAGGSSSSNGGSVPTGGDSVTSTDVPSSNSSEKIPPATEHMQSFSLGGKDINIGGDGTASAAEVQSTADSIKHLYQNSDTFKSMIDDSSDPKFDVTVGKRDDNLSWGGSNGAVFMNLNNIGADNSDRFQELLGHEFAHASIDLKHGAEMDRTASAVAAEA